jgi:hypothetical protein
LFLPCRPNIYNYLILFMFYWHSQDRTSPDPA